jgi:hypothetical protein
MRILIPLILTTSLACQAQDDEYTRKPKVDTTQKKSSLPTQPTAQGNKRSEYKTWWDKNKDKVKTGGNVGLAYYNGLAVSLSPLVSYAFNDYVMFGNTFNYSYFSNANTYGQSVHLYGVSPFVRITPIPLLFLHSEYENNYIKIGKSTLPARYIYNWLAGAGVNYPIGGGINANITALWVVKTNVPKFYQNPIIRGGIMFGF